ncbi:MAG TPA: acetamidase/formamidase family protein [Acidobacteriaceae bacterium]|jgi:acetamidase/formamidase
MNRILASACLLTFASFAAAAQTAAPQSLTGTWDVKADYYSSTLNLGLTLEQSGNKLTGRFTGDKLEGTIEGAAVHFISKDEHGTTDEVKATFKGGVLAGTVDEIDVNDPKHPTHFSFTATLATPLRHGVPQRHDFTPTVFYRQFSPFYKPVLHVAPGDTIHTTTVDAGGTDENGVRRVLGGNPETGPFFIDGAEPGDTLVVHIKRLKLNRDWAISDDGIVNRAVNGSLGVKIKDNNKDVRWHLDLANGTASPEKPGDHMKNFSIPVRPMLGCIATAVRPTQAPPGSGDSGDNGGNMDFNEITEGSTVYLPVLNPGALLYFGDGHALQGDGELNGNALETSMDVEVTVDVLPGKRIGGRRVETPDAIIAMGLQGSVDDALKEATENMVDWLQKDYKLTASEVAQFMGVASEIRISEVADRNAGIVIKIAKKHLQSLAQPPPPAK